jgi:hypothetical protein
LTKSFTAIEPRINRPLLEQTNAIPWDFVGAIDVKTKLDSYDLCRWTSEMPEVCEDRP